MLITLKGLPSSARASLTSPAAISWRMMLLETTSPPTFCGAKTFTTKVELAAELSKGIHPDLSLVTEAEVFAFVHLHYMQSVAQRGLRKGYEH